MTLDTGSPAAIAVGLLPLLSLLILDMIAAALYVRRHLGD